MLNRVFATQAEGSAEPVLVEVRDLEPKKTNPERGLNWWAPGAAGVVVLATCLLTLGLWQANQRATTEERNLQLLNQLKAVSTINPPGATGATGAKENQSNSDQLPSPPPPTEPWMEELAKLPENGENSGKLLKVPVGSVTLPGRSTPALNPTPQLIGIIQGPGGTGSAIFRIQGSATSAAVGEQVGHSGWILRRTTDYGIVIESNGIQRNLSISGDP